MTQQTEESIGFPVDFHQPLIGVIVEEGKREMVRYFTGDDAANAAISPGATKKVLGIIGAWSDLDWEKMDASLDRIRHDSVPTPPVRI